MSAFICMPEHFKVLAIFAVARANYGRPRVDPVYLKYRHAALVEAEKYLDDEARLASYYADVLYQENIRSVRHRYPSDTWDSLPGPCVKPLRLIVDSSDFLDQRLRVSSINILSMLNCLDYQSCEPEDWTSTTAHALLQAIKYAAIRVLPGYGDAVWEFVLSADEDDTAEDDTADGSRKDEEQDQEAA